MTGFTVPLGFPYPQATDPLDGPAQLQALAEAIDDSMNRAAINLYAECLRRGEWPDYNNGSIYTAESPTWLAKLEGE